MIPTSFDIRIIVLSKEQARRSKTYRSRRPLWSWSRPFRYVQVLLQLEFECLTLRKEVVKDDARHTTFSCQSIGLLPSSIMAIPPYASMSMSKANENTMTFLHLTSFPTFVSDPPSQSHWHLPQRPALTGHTLHIHRPFHISISGFFFLALFGHFLTRDGWKELKCHERTSETDFSTSWTHLLSDGCPLVP